MTQIFTDNPHTHALPHEAWRPHQRETLEWLAGTGRDVRLVEAPTGSGKTSFAAGLSTLEPVISLVRTRNLQQVNYGQTYGARVLFGRGSYPCVHPDATSGMNGEDCYYEVAMTECKCADDCPYLIAKHKAQQSRFTSLNYSYYFAAKWPRKALARLVLDEAHQLSDIVLDHSGITLSQRECERYDLSVPPSISPLLPGKAGRSLAERWLAEVDTVLSRAISSCRMHDPQTLRRKRALSSLLLKVQSTRTSLEAAPDDWYIASGQVNDAGTRAGMRFIARPLTARHVFPLHFADRQLVLMSATMGDFGVVAAELGIGEFDSRRVPHQFSPVMRRVRVLDAPRMNWKSGDAEYRQQAKVIASAVREAPSSWSGIIHTVSRVQAQRLHGLLDRMLSGRMYLDRDDLPTEQSVAEWQQWRDYHGKRQSGQIVVSWRMGEGYDGLEERICILAKTPFPNTGDLYEKRRMDYDTRFYLQRTAWAVEQALGRTRRGRVQDYGDENGLVAVADGNWTRVRSFLSESFREAILQ